MANGFSEFWNRKKLVKDYDLGLVHWVFRLRVDVFNFITIVTENEEPRKNLSLWMSLYFQVYIESEWSVFSVHKSVKSNVDLRCSAVPQPSPPQLMRDGSILSWGNVRTVKWGENLFILWATKIISWYLYHMFEIKS